MLFLFMDKNIKKTEIKRCTIKKRCLPQTKNDKTTKIEDASTKTSYLHACLHFCATIHGICEVDKNKKPAQFLLNEKSNHVLATSCMNCTHCCFQ